MTSCCELMGGAISRGIVEATKDTASSWINGVIVEYAYCPWCGAPIGPGAAPGVWTTPMEAVK